MPDMENVIKGLNDIGDFIAGRIGIEQARNFLRTIDDTIELLKEQEDLGTELTNAVELIHKKNERIEKLLKEQEHKDKMFHALEEDWKKLKEQETSNLYKCPNCGTWVSAENVVRCKDCKKRNSWECWQYFLGRIKIPDDWFCADGEKDS